MKKLSKLFVLLVCVCSLTVWSCKPAKTTSGGKVAEVVEEVNEAAGELTAASKPTTMIGSCSYYKGIKGMATITQVDGSNPDEAIIKFNFSPNEAYSSSMNSEANSGQIFNVEGVGQYPPRDWAVKSGLVQGAKVPCVRYEVNMDEEQESSCQRIKYDFPQFKESNWK